MVVAFYFRLHLAYFFRPAVAISARPEQKQGGYLIVVTFNDDINNKYYYHYEVWTHKKGEPLRFNRMALTIVDEKNSVVLEYPYDGKCKYPPIKE